MTKGGEALMAERSKKDTPPAKVEEKKAVTLEQLNEQLEQLRKEREAEKAEAEQRTRDAQIMSHIAAQVKASGVDPDFHDDLIDSIIGSYALANSRGNADLQKIISDKTATLKTKLAKHAPQTKVDLAKVEAAKTEVGKSTGSSRGAGDDPPTKWGRDAFRSKTFVQEGLDFVKNLSKKAMGDK